MEVLWKTARVSDAEGAALADALRIPLRVARWLCARGIHADDANAYLEPSAMPPFDTNLFTDMDAAIARLVYAVTQRERIVIVGDYDVDGVTASVIMARALNRLGADFLCEIPHRIADGYGLTPPIVERISTFQPALLVTVDNGIRSHEAVALAKAQGIDVIITDHHEPGTDLPPADAIVHYAKSSDETRTAVLSGAGVAHQVAEVLLNTFGVPANDAMRAGQLGLAALGALADVMPMQGENRRLVRLGLAALHRWQAPGWRALCKVARCLDEPLNDRTLLWQIAPRINAAGRMGSAKVAFDLLMCETEVEADALARQLEDFNQLRRDETERAYREAAAQIESMGAPGAAVVAAGPWHLGVAGIVAARLVDGYGCPAIVLCDAGDEVLKGSGRAPEGTSLYQALDAVEPELLHHFGGHAAAVGCGVLRQHVDGFRTALATAVSAQRVEGPAHDDGLWLADDFLPLAEVNLDLWQWLEQLAPYGPTFPTFQFYVGPLQISKLSWLKGGKHLKLTLAEDKHQIEAIWFNPPELAKAYQVTDWLAAMVEVTNNRWRGQDRIELRILTAEKLHRVRNRQDFAAVYRMLRSVREVAVSEVVSQVPEADDETARMMLDAFVELGFASRTASAYHVVEYAMPRDLRESQSYQQHLAKALMYARQVHRGEG